MTTKDPTKEATRRCDVGGLFKSITNFNVGRWTLDVGRRTLDVRRRTLDVGRWTFKSITNFKVGQGNKLYTGPGTMTIEP